MAGVKYVSQVFADSGDQSTVEEEDGEELKTWACDLDWEQPDPFAGDSRASVFGSDDGYCSTQCEVVLFNPVQHPVCHHRCTDTPACPAVSQVLDTDCGSCCSADACSR